MWPNELENPVWVNVRLVTFFCYREMFLEIHWHRDRDRLNCSCAQYCASKATVKGSAGSRNTSKHFYFSANDKNTRHDTKLQNNTYNCIWTNFLATHELQGIDRASLSLCRYSSYLNTHI